VAKWRGKKEEVFTQGKKTAKITDYKCTASIIPAWAGLASGL
jgi:hypothetical protein